MRTSMLSVAFVAVLGLPGAEAEVIVCPRALDRAFDPSSLRPDYMEVFANPEAWPETFRRTGTVKFYVANFSPDVGLDLPALVRMVERGGFRVEVEVGGLRPKNAGEFGPGEGRRQAERELRLLKHWIDAGGRIDALTTDHAIMHHLSMNFRDRDEFTKEAIEPGAGGQFEMQALMDELMEYFAAVREALPDVQFGVIESLGYYHFERRRESFPATDPRLPRWEFSEFLDALLKNAKARGIEIRWFDIDFGYNGAAQDTRRTKGRRLEVGRILAAAEAVREAGLQVGVIYNDDGRIEKDFLPGDADRRDPQRNRFAFDNTRELWRAVHPRVRPDRIILQSWSDYPEKTGPEDVEYSFFRTARELLGSVR